MDNRSYEEKAQRVAAMLAELREMYHGEIAGGKLFYKMVEVCDGMDVLRSWLNEKAAGRFPDFGD